MDTKLPSIGRSVEEADGAAEADSANKVNSRKLVWVLVSKNLVHLFLLITILINVVLILNYSWLKQNKAIHHYIVYWHDHRLMHDQAQRAWLFYLSGEHTLTVTQVNHNKLDYEHNND